MIEASDFKRGGMILVDGKPFQILSVQLSTPSARGGSTMVRTKMRNLLNASFLDKSYRSNDKFEEPDIERRGCQYLYSDDRFAFFMDKENFEQFQIAAGDLGDDALYIHDGMADVTVMLWNGGPVSVALPPHVELQIVETEPSVRGATATAQTKPAKLSTGLIVQVPAYIEGDEMIKVDTRTGDYLGRVK